MAADTSAQVRELIATHPVLRNLSDSERAVAIGVVNGAVIAVADVLCNLDAERDRYRAALARISDAESGIWGQIAHAALHPEGSNGTA